MVLRNSDIIALEYPHWNSNAGIQVQPTFHRIEKDLQKIFEKFEKPHLRPLPKKPYRAGASNGGPFEKKVKIGRNDPCPCGSGKKYKNCCINKVEG